MMRSSAAGATGWTRDTTGGSSLRIAPSRLARVLPSNAGATGEHLEQQRAEREDVGPRVGLEPFDLFGRHVLKRAEDRALRGESSAASSAASSVRRGCTAGAALFARPKSSNFAPAPASA